MAAVIVFGPVFRLALGHSLATTSVASLPAAVAWFTGTS